MKETLNNLKNSDRVKSVLIQDTINNTRSFTFTITKKPANFMTKESSLAGREKYVSNISYHMNAILLFLRNCI